MGLKLIVIYINVESFWYWNHLTDFLCSGRKWWLRGKILTICLFHCQINCATFLQFVRKPRKSIYYESLNIHRLIYLQIWHDLQWTNFNTSPHTNIFAKLIHSMYVPMHGMCWVSAVPYLCMCMWRVVHRYLCPSVVLGIFWENAWVDMNICARCACVCDSNCNVWVHLCNCLSQCLWIRFAMYKCPNIDVLDGGGEHTSLSAWDGCVRPGSAPHA